MPKSTPSLTFGQEMFSSIAATPGRPFEPRRHFDEFVARSWPAMLTMIGAPTVGQIRQVMCDERLVPVVVQADRVEHAGGGFDRSPGRVAGRGACVIVLGTIPPSRLRSTRPAISRA